MHHTAGCGSLSTTEMAEAVRELAPRLRVPTSRWWDQFGEPYVDQHGEPVTLA